MFIYWSHHWSPHEMSHTSTYPTNVHQEVLKQLPHMVGSVNFLHLHLCVDIAVVQEVDVGNLHLFGEDTDAVSLHITSFSFKEGEHLPNSS